MTGAELRAGTSLAAIFGLRMLGLFLILPVFAVHAPQYRGGGNLGGLLGGWIAGRFGAGAVFGVCALLSLTWLALAASMRSPARIGAVNGGAGLALDRKRQT